jgi:signal peptidase II
MGSKKYGVFSTVFLASLVADQWTKVWARDALKPLHHAMVVVEGYFDLSYSENTGSAFGLFQGLSFAPYLLFGVGAIALVVIVAFLRKVRPDRLRIAAELGLLAGGAVGNIIDRVRFGRVTDFVVWKVHAHQWPTFNVADAALVVGVIALLLDAKSEDTQPAAAATPAPRKK